MVNVPQILPVSKLPLCAAVLRIWANKTCSQLTFAFQLLYILALALVKSSILCFYLRVFVSTRMTCTVKAMFGVVAVWALAHALTVVFICSPVSFQWDLTISGKCGDQIKLFQSLITTNIITDVMIMVLPIYSTLQDQTLYSNNKESI